MANMHRPHLTWVLLDADQGRWEPTPVDLLQWSLYIQTDAEDATKWKDISAFSIMLIGQNGKQNCKILLKTEWKFEDVWRHWKSYNMSYMTLLRSLPFRNSFTTCVFAQELNRHQPQQCFHICDWDPERHDFYIMPWTHIHEYSATKFHECMNQVRLVAFPSLGRQQATK